MARPKKAPPVIDESDPPLRFDPDPEDAGLEEDDTVDGDPAAMFKLAGKQRDRYYIFAHNSPDDIRRYKAMGARVEVATKDGVRLKASDPGELTDGEAITVADHVLMSHDRRKYERRIQAERADRRAWKARNAKRAQRDIVLREAV